MLFDAKRNKPAKNSFTFAVCRSHFLTAHFYLFLFCGKTSSSSLCSCGHLERECVCVLVGGECRRCRDLMEVKKGTG